MSDNLTRLRAGQGSQGKLGQTEITNCMCCQKKAWKSSQAASLRASPLACGRAKSLQYLKSLERPKGPSEKLRCVQCRGRGVKAAGRVKKGGAGGKFTWGGLMSPGLDRAPSPVLDRNDPNYESGDDGEMEQHMTAVQSQQVKQYKQSVSALAAEKLQVLSKRRDPKTPDRSLLHAP